MATEFSLDDVPAAFKAFDRDLKKRGIKTTQSREDAIRIKSLIEAWFRFYRPELVSHLGETEAIGEVDDLLQDVRTRVGSRIDVSSLRDALRRIARLIERRLLPDFEVARWTEASSAKADALGFSDQLVHALNQLSSGLGDSYRQVYIDLREPGRLTFVGPAGEIREVFREVIHLLAPDEEVSSQSWFVGHDGRATQAERIRYIRQGQKVSEPADRAIELIDIRVGQLGRDTYRSASGAFHAGTARHEVETIVGYVEVLLREFLFAPSE